MGGKVVRFNVHEYSLLNQSQMKGNKEGPQVFYFGNRDGQMDELRDVGEWIFL